MSKKTSSFAAAIVIGSLFVVNFVPAAYAHGPNAQWSKRQNIEQQMQKMFNQMHKRSHMQVQKQHTRQGGTGKFLSFFCSDNAITKIENRLEKMAQILDLNSEQENLFNDYKSAFLTAQTQYADNCIIPEKNANLDLIDRIKIQQKNTEFRISAINEILPQFEAFFDSLTDEQKGKIAKVKANIRNQIDGK